MQKNKISDLIEVLQEALQTVGDGIVAMEGCDCSEAWNGKYSFNGVGKGIFLERYK
jgi:hypothetical protein